MAAASKAQLLTEVYTLLKKRYKLGPREGRLSVLEAVIFGICQESTTREQAFQALNRFKDHFFDWNEVRVSSVEEIADVLAGLPEPEERARRVRRFLRQLFTRTYGFSLESLLKKPQKESVKALQEFEALQSDFVLASVIQHALGGHAIPVDGPIRRGLERLGVAEPGVDDAALRASLERAVPKNRGGEFADLMEELTHDTCVAGVPDCPRCELRKICPTGQGRMAAEKAAHRAAARAAAKSTDAHVEGLPVAAKPPRSKAAPAASAEKPKATRGKSPRSK